MIHIPAHVLGMCGPSPIPPDRLVLSITTRTIDVQLMKTKLWCRCPGQDSSGSVYASQVAVQIQRKHSSGGLLRQHDAMHQCWRLLMVMNFGQQFHKKPLPLAQ